jgi:hypothetical protein
VFAPFQVIGTFGVAFLPAVDEDEIGLHAAVWRQNYRAIAQALVGPDAFGEINFLALGVRHGRYLRSNLESV